METIFYGNGEKERYTYDEFDQLIQLEKEDGITYTYGYDPQGDRVNYKKLNEDPLNQDSWYSILDDIDEEKELENIKQQREETFETFKEKLENADIYKCTFDVEYFQTQWYQSDAEQIIDKTKEYHQVLWQKGEGNQIYGNTRLYSEGENSDTTYIYGINETVYGYISNIDDKQYIKKNAYEDYGHTPGIGTGYGYNGEFRDESGLIYLRARYYNPKIARFIQIDSFKGTQESIESQNRYIYVLNNPYKYSDPSGHDATTQYEKYKNKKQAGGLKRPMRPVKKPIEEMEKDAVVNNYFKSNGFITQDEIDNAKELSIRTTLTTLGILDTLSSLCKSIGINIPEHTEVYIDKVSKWVMDKIQNITLLPQPCPPIEIEQGASIGDKVYEKSDTNWIRHARAIGASTTDYDSYWLSATRRELQKRDEIARQEPSTLEKIAYTIEQVLLGAVYGAIVWGGALLVVASGGTALATAGLATGVFAGTSGLSHITSNASNIYAMWDNRVTDIGKYDIMDNLFQGVGFMTGNDDVVTWLRGVRRFTDGGAVVAGIIISGTSGVENILNHDLFEIGFNKINHILQEKHLWSRLVNNANDWSSVSKIMERVLKEGVEQPYGKVFIKTLIIDGQTVQVTYQKINGVIRVSDGWIKP